MQKKGHIKIIAHHNIPNNNININKSISKISYTNIMKYQNINHK